MPNVGRAKYFPNGLHARNFVTPARGVVSRGARLLLKIARLLRYNYVALARAMLHIRVTNKGDTHMTNAALVRKFSMAGPCIPLGTLVSESAKFFCYQPRGRNGYDATPKAKRISKSGDFAHVVPCVSCRDHAQTQYPNGYED